MLIPATKVEVGCRSGWTHSAFKMAFSRSSPVGSPPELRQVLYNSE